MVKLYLQYGNVIKARNVVLLLALLFAVMVKAQDCSKLSDYTNVCIGTSQTFDAGVDSGSAKKNNPGNNYGCLGSTPNSKWFFFKANTSGTLNIKQTNSNDEDVDGAIWGPFDSIEDITNRCRSYPAPLACDYASADYFNFSIQAEAGKYYVLLVGSISATNVGVAGATGVKITDILPVGVTYVSHTTAEGTYNQNTGIWNIGDMPLHKNATLEIKTKINKGTEGTTITNTVSKVELNETESNNLPDVLSAKVKVLEDSDGDGIPDKNDLDDDNDGILDTEECVGNGHNGYPSTGILTVEKGGGLNNGDHLLVFDTVLNNTLTQPWNTNYNGLPRLRIIITENGVEVTGTQYRVSTTMQPIYLKDGNFVTNPNFSTGDNEVILHVPDGGGPDGANVNFTMEGDFCKDTDGDGIINRLDLDSDSDGCPDAIEGGGDIKSDQLNADNSINSEVDTDGVPALVNGGQVVGGAQKAGKIEVTEQPQDQDVCIGSNAEFSAKATAKSTEVFNGGTPDYTGATTEQVTYQWQKYNTTTSTWEDISGQSGTENSGENITLDLGTQNNTDSNGTKYRIKLTSLSMSCPEYSDEAALKVKELPNNTSSGFIGANICFGETAKLTYNADNTGFTTPHTIVYKKIGTTNTYTQTITVASAFEFMAGDAPTTAGTHKYEIVSITDGNGCVRTSDFGKSTAQIKIKGEVECLITGDDTVCPKKTFTYSAPDNMKTYNWSVTGNATIQGANNTQNVNVLTGDLNSGNDFTLTVVVRSKGGCEKTCTKTVSVADSTKPTFTKPADVSLCVNNIINANYNDTTNGDVNTPPDYYEFPVDYTDLDITNVSDDCCDTENTITWTITPTSSGTTISGTGQPSATLSSKKLWLDVATSNPKSSYTEKTYTIKYKVTDCNGNKSEEQTTTITIKPRPKINTN